MMIRNETLTYASPAITWIACPKPNASATLRLICFSYAGGSASAFVPWAKLLPPSVELWVMQLPGRENRIRETPYRDFSRLIKDMVAAFLPYLDDKPVVFFGHSLGALIAFETARYLRQNHGLQPVHLFVSGRRAPHLINSEPLLHPLPDAAFIREIQRRYGGIPQVILQEQELLQLFLPTLRADIEVLESYDYLAKAPLDCSISAFGGRQDSRASESELAEWQQHTRHNFKLTMMPGDHFFIQSARPQLLQMLTADLASFAA